MVKSKYSRRVIASCIQNRDDVLTYLIHLGYLGYNEDNETAFVPNEEIRQELITAVRSSNWDEALAYGIINKDAAEGSSETVSNSAEIILQIYENMAT